MSMKREIIFLNRAYNDIDIQMSLIDAFAGDGRFSVRVIGYPADGDVGMPDMHEASPYMRTQRGVSFENLMDVPQAPLYLSGLYNTVRFLGALRHHDIAQAKFLAWPLKATHVTAMMALRKALRAPQPWMREAAQEWQAAAIIIDEIYAQPGRSYVTDVILPELQERGVPVYMIQTGHNIYCTPAPSGRQATYKKTAAKLFFMPCTLDRDISRLVFPDERHEIAGNLRMDASWLARLKNEVLVPPYYPVSDVIADFPRGKVKVVMMLSKMSYGVLPEELKKTIRRLGEMDNIALVIKPHTRGMKFDFMSHAEIRRAYVAENVPSAVLSEWADIILFTGSSVAYHAMLRGKVAGFLKYCQRQETVFDKGVTAIVFDSAESLQRALEENASGIPFMSEEARRKMSEHLIAEVYAGDPSGNIAQRHKNIILQNLDIDL